MAYTDEEINIMARQLVEASQGTGLGNLLGGLGTDDDKFKEIMGRVSQLPSGRKTKSCFRYQYLPLTRRSG